MNTITNHSFSNPDEVTLKHLNLNLEADFESKSLKGFAEWDIVSKKDVERVVLDIKSLEILSIEIDGLETDFSISQENELLGSALNIPISLESKKIRIYYQTLPEAEALQWLSPEQTAGKPFLFTQSQAILARTWVPCMDLPAVRFTYEATITCPNDLLPLMSASNPTEKNEKSEYHFKMPQPIPSYLLALCIGDLEFAPLGAECGVYAEPDMLAKSKAEFEDLESMIKAAENLYGPYQWGRYDVVVLPPSFPFGGMENPRLTFATPTIITGDKSLVSLIAHELAHSWSGNLVTNHTWSDFWLNEGFTVYFEDRIMEAVYGKDYANMMAKIGLGELQETVKDFLKYRPEDTKLYLNLDGRTPDDGVTDIAYEKGRFFLLSLERLVGRERFDAFLNTYFNHFAFKTITTEQFISYVNLNLFENEKEANKARLEEWIFETGLPDNCPKIESKYLGEVDALILKLESGQIKISKDIASNWTTHHYLYFLRNLSSEYLAANFTELDAAFQFTQTQNSEIACDWFRICVENNNLVSRPQIEKFLTSVGRRKFLTPIYKAMMKNREWNEFAKQVFEKAGRGYHAVAFNTIKEIVSE